MARFIMVALSGVVFVASLAARQPIDSLPAPSPQQITAADYTGADACKECHEKAFDTWNRTKHAKAFGKLQTGDRNKAECVGCHVTGTPEMVAAEGPKPSHPNVQCESCHGAGKRHIDAAKGGDAGNARTMTIDEATCLRCHNEKSPHYKPFIYRAMVGLVHRTGN